MADFQFHPESHDPLSRLRTAMDKLDGTQLSITSQLAQLLFFIVEAITAYRIPPEKEDYVINPEGPSSSTSEVATASIDPQLVAKEATSSIDKTTTPQGPRSNLRLFPPPIFSRQNIAQSYKSALQLSLSGTRIS